MPIPLPMPYSTRESTWYPDPNTMTQRCKDLTYQKCLRCGEVVDYTDHGAYIEGERLHVGISVVFMTDERDDALCQECTGEIFVGCSHQALSWKKVPLEIFQSLLGDSEGLIAFTEVQSQK